MNIEKIGLWNQVHGISSTMSRNLIVGLLVGAWFILIPFFIYVIIYVNSKRVADTKEFYHRLEREKAVQDSLSNIFRDKLYELKLKEVQRDAK